jgi:hypothetical protein
VTTLNKSGIRVRAGTTPREAFSVACAKGANACTEELNASVANAAALILPDARALGRWRQSHQARII